MTLTEFLLARFAEDEADLAESRWDGSAEWWMPDWLTRDRLRADLDAKRRIVELATQKPGRKTTFRRVLTLRAVAEVYADHPDYDPAWRA